MSPKEIDIAMKEMPKEWRYRWCEGKICACLGAANCSGGLSAKGFTKQQWEHWKADNEIEAQSVRR